MVVMVVMVVMVMVVQGRPPAENFLGILALTLKMILSPILQGMVVMVVVVVGGGGDG